MDISADFRSAMRRIASTVNLITCAYDGSPHGMAATAVTSVSTDPASILVCVNTNASISEPLKAGKRFCVNVLGSGHVNLSHAFSGRLKGKDRFTMGPWLTDAEGTPYLEDAQANIFCMVERIIPFGTHDIVIGMVRQVRTVGEVSPLIYGDGHYARAQDLAD